MKSGVTFMIDYKQVSRKTNELNVELFSKVRRRNIGIRIVLYLFE
jgi:hypothetical protein